MVDNWTFRMAQTSSCHFQEHLFVNLTDRYRGSVILTIKKILINKIKGSKFCYCWTADSAMSWVTFALVWLLNSVNISLNCFRYDVHNSWYVYFDFRQITRAVPRSSIMHIIQMTEQMSSVSQECLHSNFYYLTIFTYYKDEINKHIEY